MLRFLRMLLTMLAIAEMGTILASCARSTDPTTGATTSTIDPQLQNVITAIKSNVLKACGFQVAIDSVSAIVGTFVPGVSLVGEVTTQICKAVTALGVRRGMSTPMVNGVPVVGRFVR